MVAQKVIRVKVTTTAATAKKDVEEAVERAAQGTLKETMGPLAAPVAAKVAEIMGQKAEEVSKGWLKGRNCFLLSISDSGKPQVEEAYNTLLESPTDDYTIYIITWRGDLYPGKIKDAILSHYEKHGIKPEEIRKCNRIGIFVHGSTARASIYGGLQRPPIGAEELFDAVETFLEPGGELWLFICGGEQEEWDKAVAESNRPFRAIVWPGEGEECDFDDNMKPYVDPMLGR